MTSRTTLARGALALSLLVAAAAWTGALLAAAGAEAPALLVYGEPSAKRGSTLPMRVVAVSASERRRVAFTGRAETTTGSFAIEGGVARVTLPAGGDEARVRIVGVAAGVPLDVTARVALASEHARRIALVHAPWTTELLRPTAEARAGPPVYPVEGTLPAMLPGALVVVEGERVDVVERAPNAAGAAAPDGRPLRLDRTDVDVSLPLVVEPGAVVPVRVRAVDDEPVYLDVIGDGAVRELAVVDVKGGEGVVEVALPGDIAAEWIGVHATTSPLGNAQGDTAVAPVGAGRPFFRAVEPLVAGAAEPLLGLPAVLDDERVARALVGRLRFSGARPPNLAPPVAAQAAERRDAVVARVARWRVPFRLAGGAFALFSTWLALTSALEGRRWREHAEEEKRQLGPLLWASLAFLASLSVLATLDWILGLVMRPPPA